MVQTLQTDRYSFGNWEKTDEGWWRSICAITIGGQEFPEVELTVKELDSDKINAIVEQLKLSVNEFLEMHDEELDLVFGSMDFATVEGVDFEIFYS